MSTLYLHIGSSKTGTSAIQVFLGDNKEKLAEQGIAFPIFDIQYPTIRKERNAHFLVDKSEHKEENYSVIVEQIKLISTEYDKIILTDESIWNNQKSLQTFCKDMNSNNIDVKIVVYLRRQDLYLQSQWAQNVKETSTKDFIDYIGSAKIHLDYYKFLSKIEKNVGKENIILRPYERQQFEQQDLLIDFMTAVGIKNDENFSYRKKTTNRSLSGVYLEVKRMLNRNSEFATRANFSIPYLYRLMEINEDTQSYSSNKFFTNDQQKECLDKFAQCNKKVAEEFLGREDGVLFRDEIKQSDGKIESFSKEECVDILGQFIVLQHNDVLKLQNRISKYKKKINALEKQVQELSIPFYKKISRKLKRTFKRK